MTSLCGTIEIEKRFCGPARSGNGGYTCGRLAAFIEGPARARLMQPPPLDTPIRIIAEGAGVAAYAGDQKIGMAEPSTVDVTLPDIPDASGIKAARQAYLSEADTHPLAQCFVCGPKRAPHDGLCLFTGPVPGSVVNADVWTPDADLADQDGLVRPEFLWAALDCPTAFALRHGDSKLCLLGSLTAEIRSRPKTGERLTVMAWPRGVDGRKNYADGAILNAAGEVLAVSNAVWIELTDPEMIAAITEGA